MARPKAERAAPAAPQAFLTKSELARRHIEEMILGGRARVGDRLTTREVSEALGMSETPIREAVRALAAEGWLDLSPHSGVVVAAINRDQLREVYAMRGALAGVALEVGGPHLGATRLAQVERNLRNAGIAVERGDARRYAQLNREFHTLLADTAATQRTLKVLQNLWAQTAAMHRGFELVPEQMARSLIEHRAIVSAIAAGQYALAASLVVEHERAAGEALLAHLG
jgi:DNA-binding GntR family transcriptional regulator